jgi:hypothetical protein
MPSPEIVTRFHYYPEGSENRDFYSGAKDGDYISYIDTGIQQNKRLDYVEYMGDETKSSGVFNAAGLLTKPEKKALRERLRGTKSIIWDCVISFEEGYGKRHSDDWIEAQSLLKDVLPRFFREAGFDPKKVEWYAGLHRNTDNRHIHVSFYQTEPTIWNQRKKACQFRKGRIDGSHFDSLKAMSYEHFLSPDVESRRLRSEMREAAMMASRDPDGMNVPSIKKSLADLYETMPSAGNVQYRSANMDGCRKTVDKIAEAIIDGRDFRGKYNSILMRLDEHDERMREFCRRNKIRNPEPYLRKGKFIEDYKARMGNAIIEEALSQKRAEAIMVGKAAHPREAKRIHKESALQMALLYRYLAAKIEEEAENAYDRELALMAKARKEAERDAGGPEM